MIEKAINEEMEVLYNSTTSGRIPSTFGVTTAPKGTV